MKYSFLALFAWGGIALAQDIDKPEAVTAIEAANAFALRPPDEGSPFFADRAAVSQVVNNTARQQGKAQTVAVYPSTKNSSQTAGAMFKAFFTDMFASVNWRGFRGDKTTQKLEVEPKEFSLQERREVNVTYLIRNNTKKILRIDYPSSQRIELETKNPQGQVIEKWSDDRAFEQREGIVIINPGERIEYAEKLPTRDMKPGESYTIEGTVPENPQFTQQAVVVPQP